MDFRPGAGIRIAPHFYTTDDEIAHTIHELSAIIHSAPYIERSTCDPMSTQVTSSEAAGQHLQRSLSTGQLSMIAIGGAIGTGLFLGSGFAIGLAGPAVLLVFAIGALIALLLMGCLAEMTVAHPTSGSFGAWAEYYLIPLAGFLVRYLYWSVHRPGRGHGGHRHRRLMRYWFPARPRAGFGYLFVLLLPPSCSASTPSRSAPSVQSSTRSPSLKVLAIVGFLRAPRRDARLQQRDASSMGLHLFTASGGFFPPGSSGTWKATIVVLFSYFVGDDRRRRR